MDPTEPVSSSSLDLIDLIERYELSIRPCEYLAGLPDQGEGACAHGWEIATGLETSRPFCAQAKTIAMAQVGACAIIDWLAGHP